MIKYSIILPYYKRDSLFSTLMSYWYHYPVRRDFEIVIVEDRKNFSNSKEHDKLMSIIERFPEFNIGHMVQDFRDCICPSVSYNYGVRNSSGKFIILSNPEGFHMSDILGGLDGMFGENENIYAVCACLSVRKFEVKSLKDFENGISYNKIEWYQHSVHSPRNLNFCTAISRENYDRIGGFDENYANGYARADDDFVRMIARAGIPIVPRDDLLTLHIEHPREYEISPAEMREKMETSRRYYNRKWSVPQ